MSRIPAARLRSIARPLVALLALLAAIQWLAFDWYEVRGNSMWPLLVDAPSGNDRLVGLAYAYRFSPPARFDLVVFDRPPGDFPGAQVADVSGDRCVKRVIATGGEIPFVHDGDLFLERRDGDVARTERLLRPLEVILQMLVPVDEFVATTSPSSTTRWRVSGPARIEGAALVLESGGETARDARLRYEALIKNDWVDSEGRVQPGGDTVNDVGVEFVATCASQDTVIRVELREQADLFAVEFGPDRPLAIERRRGTAADAPVVLSAARRFDGSATGSDGVPVRVMNVDDEILVWFDGDLAGRFSYEGNEPVLGVSPNDPSIAVTRGAASLRAIRIVRDAWYTQQPLTAGGSSGVKVVPEGSLWVLGDNGANSIDSRDFGAIPLSSVRGRPILRYRAGAGWKKM